MDGIRARSVSTRTYALASLALLAAYTLVLGSYSGNPSASFEVIQPFPFGRSNPGDLSNTAGISLILGAILGWGVPGLSLALLIDHAMPAKALLARAWGLGVGYIFLVGIAVALFTGHGPGRSVLLLALAAPSIALAVVRSTRRQLRGDLPLLTALLAMLLLTLALWPRLCCESLSGDATEVFELSRSLSLHRFPYWDMEQPGGLGKFGMPIVVPYVVPAYFGFSQMAIMGMSEIAVRLPFVIATIVAAVTALDLSKRRGTATPWLLVATVCVYVLWSVFYVGDDPGPQDIAALAGSDTIGISLWLVGIRELLLGTVGLGVVFLAFASATTWASSLLTIPAVLALLIVNRQRGRRALSISLVLVAVLGLIVSIWFPNLVPEWTAQLRREYFDEFTGASERVPSAGLMGRFILATAGVPLFVPLFWRRLSEQSRILYVAAASYLILVLISDHKNLHYIAPLLFVFVVPASDVLSARGVGLAASIAGLVAILSWPEHRPLRYDLRSLGRETCLRERDYEAAVLLRPPIQDVLGISGSTPFEVGPHSFVRYGLELGSDQCTFGLSRETPPGAITLARGPTSTLWSADVAGLVDWRFRVVTVSESPLFRYPARPQHSKEPSAWLGVWMLDTYPGSGLLLKNTSDEDASVRRVLVPIVDSGSVEVRIGMSDQQPRTMSLRVNGGEAVSVRPQGGAVVLGPETHLHRGWNVVEIRATPDVKVQWIDLRLVATSP